MANKPNIQELRENVGESGLNRIKLAVDPWRDTAQAGVRWGSDMLSGFLFNGLAAAMKRVGLGVADGLRCHATCIPILINANDGVIPSKIAPSLQRSTVMVFGRGCAIIKQLGVGERFLPSYTCVGVTLQQRLSRTRHVDESIKCARASILLSDIFKPVHFT